MIHPVKIYDMKMNKVVTKKLFREKVIKELQTHPYYLENKNIFDKTIQIVQCNEKHFVIHQIMHLLEENFNHKNNHKMKFQSVLNELMLFHHKRNFQSVLNELMLVHHKRKFSLVLKQMLKKSNNNDVGYSPLLIVMVYFLMIIFIPFNWFDN